MIAKNLENGKTFQIDRKRARIRRCQNRVHAWANGVDYLMRSRGDLRMVMVTMTYRPGEEWQPNDITHFLYICRKELGEALFGYAWAAEMQERGAVHYHLELVVKRGANVPYFDEAGWWVHGTTHFSSGPVRSPYYICSYTSKEGYQKMGDFPLGLRMFAVYIRPGTLSRSQAWNYHISVYPAWLREILVARAVLYTFESARRKKGGGWIIADEVVQSAWEVQLENSDYEKEEKVSFEGCKTL